MKRMLSTIQHAVSFYLENKWQLFNKFLQCLDNAFISNNKKDNELFSVSCGEFFRLYLNDLFKNKRKKIDIEKKTICYIYKAISLDDLLISSF